MNSYDVIIGANNDTHMVEIDSIAEITSRYYDKYMIIPNVISIENNQREELLIVIVISDEPKLVEYCEVVRRELEQCEVAYRLSNEIKSATKWNSWPPIS